MKTRPNQLINCAKGKSRSMKGTIQMWSRWMWTQCTRSVSVLCRNCQRNTDSATSTLHDLWSMDAAFWKGKFGFFTGQIFYISNDNGITVIVFTIYTAIKNELLCKKNPFFGYVSKNLRQKESDGIWLYLKPQCSQQSSNLNCEFCFFRFFSRKCFELCKFFLIKNTSIDKSTLC